MSIAGPLKPLRRSRGSVTQHRYSVVEFSPARQAPSGLLVWHPPRSAGCLQGKRPKAGTSLPAFKLARSSAAAPPLVRRSITGRLICSRRSISIEFEGPDSRPPQGHQTNLVRREHDCVRRAQNQDSQNQARDDEYQDRRGCVVTCARPVFLHVGGFRRCIWLKWISGGSALH